MNFEILTTDDFEKSFKVLAKKYRSIVNDIQNLRDSLKQNPFQGDELTPGIRKIRMAITSKGRGKSGGARVITKTIVYTETEGKVFLLEIYDKADTSTVDVEILKQIVAGLGLEQGSSEKEPEK